MKNLKQKLCTRLANPDDSTPRSSMGSADLMAAMPQGLKF
jgi:hypothetical protein